MGKPRRAGAYTDQRLNLSKLWEGPRKKCQGFKPDPGNPAVRDYRGASGNVSHGGNVHPSCNRKSGKRKPPTYSGARPISIPISSHRLHPPLRNRVRPGRPERRSHLLNAEALQAAIESRGIATVTRRRLSLSQPHLCRAPDTYSPICQTGPGIEPSRHKTLHVVAIDLRERAETKSSRIDPASNRNSRPRACIRFADRGRKARHPVTGRFPRAD